MVSQHPATFGDHKHCGSGDMMFLAVEKQEFHVASIRHYSLSLKHMA